MSDLITQRGEAPTSKPQRVRVIGGGLAGCEAALQLASRGFKVDLYEMRPVKNTPAHKDGHLAQLVCSNSFKALGITSAHGLLKQELTMLGSFLLDSAREAAVPAGDSLTVNRDIFSESVEKKIAESPNITLHREEVTSLEGDCPTPFSSPLATTSLFVIYESLSIL